MLIGILTLSTHFIFLLKFPLSIQFISLLVRLFPAVSDGHDKPFYSKAITIIDDFKNALGDTDNR